MAIDIGRLPFQKAKKAHFRAGSDAWKRTRARLVHARTENTWAYAFEKRGANLQSCATRVSVALVAAGAEFALADMTKKGKQNWVKQTEGVHRAWMRPNGKILPSSASEYPELLANGRSVAGPDEITGEVGVIYFRNSGTDHVTLWDVNQCNHGPNDSWFGEAVLEEAIFWKMSNS